MYAAWIKIDDTLPWIELEGTYQTKGEARKAAKKFLNSAKIKFANVGEHR